MRRAPARPPYDVRALGEASAHMSGTSPRPVEALPDAAIRACWLCRVLMSRLGWRLFMAALVAGWGGLLYFGIRTVYEASVRRGLIMPVW